MSKKSEERRGGKRVPWVRPASLKLSKEQKRVLATTRDVSERGAYLVAESKIEQGAEIDLIFVLPPELAAKGEGWVRCQARVVRVENPPGGFTAVGFEFVEPSPRFWPVEFPPTDWGAA